MGRLTSLALVTLAVPFVLTAQTAGPASPIEAYNVVPELPGMGRPVDTAAVAARRRALLKRIGSGSVLIPAGHERNIEQDYVQDNDFRQDSTFYYFTELETQDAVLMMTARGPDSIETVLFLPPRTPSQERWTGMRMGPDTTAVRLSGITTVLPIDSLEARARAAVQPVYAPHPAPNVQNLTPIVDSMRVVKDADEVSRLRRAVEISVAGHIAAMRAARPGMYEYQVEAVLEEGFRGNGADRLGYPSIVGSGPNSTTLHYDVNRRKTETGDLVVMDAAAEWGPYTADVTRTFPVNGKFTARQKAIYDLVLATQQAACDSTRPGVTIAQLNRIARAYMRAHSGTLCGVPCDAYFIHGLSHGLGMDVHDVGDYRTPLKQGMVITIEPGIYLP